MDEARDRGGGREHDHHGNADGDDHHGQFAGDPDGGKDRVERKDEIHDGDVQHDEPKRPGLPLWIRLVVVIVDFAVDFERRLTDQEDPRQDQHYVAPGEIMPYDRHDRSGQRDEPGEACKAGDAEHQGQDKTEEAGEAGLPDRQAGAEERQEDHIVDAEDDLHRAQRGERQPPRGRDDPSEIHHGTGALRFSPRCRGTGPASSRWLPPWRPAR